MMVSLSRGRVLIIAGSDSGGGAGIQADIKTVTCLGGFATTAVTALTAQNTKGVFGIHPVPESFVRDQIAVVMEDIGADCIKIGMLATTGIIRAVSQALDDFAADVPVVLDPVMYAKGGHALLEPDAVQAMKEMLIPKSFLITPNLPEAGALVGQDILDESSMVHAMDALRELGSSAVLLKGGHLDGDLLVDLLIHADGVDRFQGERMFTRHTHGTGCTLASAVATGLAQGLSPLASVTRARDYVRVAIETAPGFGHGHGPLNHNHTLQVHRAAH
nr:bifunctional hydroxymethylpyrimidine kinase/phosphomethylpyrimidine kinase [Haematospirillum jordaniae]